MTVPAVGIRCFGVSCLWGLGLGLLYGFLRPLRPKHTALADTAFLFAAVYGFLQVGFRVCGGDIRLGILLGQALGFCGVENTLNRWLRPVFSGFWRLWGLLGRKISTPLKKFFQFSKILFASGEKWVTIE